jgi:hypothetical protein
MTKGSNDAKNNYVPSVFLTFTSFQNVFVFADPPLPLPIAFKSCPLFNSSACFLLRATRTSECSAVGIGALGGGPEAVMGATLAGCEVEACRHR